MNVNGVPESEHGSGDTILGELDFIINYDTGRKRGTMNAER